MVIFKLVTDVVCGLLVIRIGVAKWRNRYASLPSELGINECT
jgi:hypothetical protein